MDEMTDEEFEEFEKWLYDYFKPSDETLKKYKKDLREFLNLKKDDVKYVPVKRLYKDFDYPERERQARELLKVYREERPRRQKLRFKSKRKSRRKSKAKKSTRRKSKAKKSTRKKSKVRR